MSEPKFTPGPWVMVFDNRNDALCIWNKEKDFLIASIALLGVKGEIEKRRFADFNLIADAWQLPDLRKENAELKEINKELIEALEQMEHLINNSSGIVGYYMNGNVAKWNDFDVTRIIGKALHKARGEEE